MEAATNTANGLVPDLSTFSVFKEDPFDNLDWSGIINDDADSASLSGNLTAEEIVDGSETNSPCDARVGRSLANKIEDKDEAPTALPKDMGKSDKGAAGLSGRLADKIEDHNEAPTAVLGDVGRARSSGEARLGGRPADGINSQAGAPNVSPTDILMCIRETRGKLDWIESNLTRTWSSIQGKESCDTGYREPKRRRQPRDQQTSRKRQKTTDDLVLQVSRVFLNDVEYVWKQPRGEFTGRWQADGGTDFDGYELLTFVSGLSIELRPNLEWLPVTVRWSERKGHFEVSDMLNEKKLVVDDKVMINMVCNPTFERGNGRLEQGCF